MGNVTDFAESFFLIVFFNDVGQLDLAAAAGKNGLNAGLYFNVFYRLGFDRAFVFFFISRAGVQRVQQSVRLIFGNIAGGGIVFGQIIQIFQSADAVKLFVG